MTVGDVKTGVYYIVSRDNGKVSYCWRWNSELEKSDAKEDASKIRLSESEVMSNVFNEEE